MPKKFSDEELNLDRIRRRSRGELPLLLIPELLAEWRFLWRQIGSVKTAANAACPVDQPASGKQAFLRQPG